MVVWVALDMPLNEERVLMCELKEETLEGSPPAVVAPPVLMLKGDCGGGS